jgi:glycosyltransferase involved in cell wall biosynthesis
LDSIVAQGYPATELIVIDGQSSEKTVEIIKSYKDKIAYWESLPDTGVFQASNRGIRRATGDWICCFGSDDYLWTPDVLEKLAPHLVRAYPDHTFIQARVVLVDTNSEIVKQLGVEPWSEMKQPAPHNLAILFSRGFCSP